MTMIQSINSLLGQIRWIVCLYVRKNVKHQVSRQRSSKSLCCLKSSSIKNTLDVKLEHSLKSHLATHHLECHNMASTTAPIFQLAYQEDKSLFRLIKALLNPQIQNQRGLICTVARRGILKTAVRSKFHYKKIARNTQINNFWTRILITPWNNFQPNLMFQASTQSEKMLKALQRCR